MQLGSQRIEPEARPTAGLRSNAEATGLSVKGVWHGFRSGDSSRVVLENITFDIEPGTFVTVMGPSGCGKSTLLRICAGFIKPTLGYVEWNGKRIQGPGAERGFVLQQPALYPWLSVRDNILFGPRARHIGAAADRRADELIDEVGLKGFENHRPYELSGGMQNRAALARTIVNEPDVLLMDEPFAALDAQTRSEMQALLLEVWQRHKSTVMFVTHDIEEALLLADRAVILSRGPGRVQSTLTVDFPRPRDYDLVLEPQFVRLRREVRDMLQAGA